MVLQDAISDYYVDICDGIITQQEQLINLSSHNNSDSHVHDDTPDCDNWKELRALRNRCPRSLILGFLNINSLRNKYLCLKDIFDSQLVDYFSVLETKIDESFPDAQFHPQDYAITREDVSEKSGGIMTFIRSDIPFNRKYEIEINNEAFHSLCVQISVNKEKWLIASIYRPPSTDPNVFLDNLNTLIDRMLSITDMIIIMGDTNIDILKNDSRCSALKDLLNGCNLQTIVKEPTCFKATPSLIDHIYVNKPRRFISHINYDCGLSDYHHLVCMATKMSVPHLKPRIKLYRSFKKFNQESFISDLNSVPFQVANIFDDIDDSYWAFSHLLTNVIDGHAPKKKKLIKHSDAPFMNKELRQAMYRKRLAHNKAKKDRHNSAKWNDYRSKRNFFVSLKKVSMQRYFRDKCSNSNNAKSFWNTVRPYLSNKSKNQNYIKLQEDNIIVNNPNCVADIFNKYFSSVTSEMGITEDFDGSLLTDIIEHYRDHPSITSINANYNENSFSFNAVSQSQVVKILKDINPQKATGHDGIPPKLLKLLAPALALPIASLTNLLIQRGQFPSELKKAEITPIFKKDNNLDKSKYRPVSILPGMAIVIERIISEQLNVFCNNIYHENLSAYRKCYNTESVVLKSVEDWKLSLDSNSCTGAVCIDLSKAFDVIPHGLLLAKLNAYGCDNNVLKFLCSYLTDRSQRVKIDNNYSKWSKIVKGVPQGSVIGPSAFNIFINDVFNITNNSTIYNYADDNVLSCSAKTYVDLKSLLESNIVNISKWFDVNGMISNPDKFQVIIFGSSNELEYLNIQGHLIKCQKVVKHLGVLIDNKLDFNNHIDHICKKTGKQVNAIYRLCNILDEETKVAIYNSFIKANFDYCPLIWAFCNKGDIVRLQKIQNRAIRFVHNDFECNSMDLLLKYNEHSIVTLNIYKIAVQMFKCYHDISPSYICSLFKKRNNVYNNRHAYNYDLRRPRTIRYGQKCFSYMGPKIWNSLSYELKTAENLNCFKSLIRSVKLNVNDLNELLYGRERT